MKKIIISESSELDNVINSLDGDWVFRGQSDSKWKIETSILRFFETTESLINRNTQQHYISAEKSSFYEFCSTAPLYLQHLPESDDMLGWYSVMQHYGVPTRLLDVTCSPYVALFFAMDSGANNASIFCIKPSHFSTLDENEYLDENNYSEFITEGLERNHKISLYYPSWSSERSFQQQGLFLVPNTLNRSFSSLLGDYGEDNGHLLEIVISKDCRIDFIRKLIDMNITSSTLFPSLEGYSRSIKNLLVHYLSGANEDSKLMPNKWFQRTPLKLRR